MGESGESLRDLVERRARTHPDVPAVGRSGTGWITLGGLDRAANRLAWDLADRGAGPGDVVGLLLPRSVEFVVAVLAVWKIGAAYTPVDPAGSPSHRSFVLDDSGVRCVVTGSDAADEALGRPYCFVPDPMANPPEPAEEFPSAPLAATDPAWILYTSGSTGRPKGVIGSHGASLNRCTWMWQAQPFGDGDVCVQNTGPSVVDSIWEVWGALARGRAVVVPPAHAAFDLDLLIEILADDRVTRICLVPSLLRTMLTTYPDLGERLPALRTWTCSGETLDRGLADTFHTTLPGRILLNQYGLTESCADVTTYDTRHLPRGDGGDARVPIGRPIRDTRIHIVDEDLRPVPAGEPGELCLAGPALANGYLNAPELTRSRFLPGGLGTGDTVLRTGDIVRIGQDGELHHLGRRDRQTKIRGFRVEAEGVEAVLKACSGVKDGAVRVWQRGPENVLAAYVVPMLPGSPPDAGELRTWMRRELPAHAVPSFFTVLPEFPRTSSGKIDYKLLPEPVGQHADADVILPRDEVEQTIADIWREVLPVARLGVLDDFHEAGGHSLALMRVIARANSAYGVRLRRSDLCGQLTVESMARAVALLTAAGPGTPPAPDGYGTDRASETQMAMWLHERCTPAPGLYNIQFAFRIGGMLDTTALDRALDDVVARHRALRLGLVYTDGALRLIDSGPSADTVRLAVVDTSESLLGAHLGDEGARPFDLASGPLVRGMLLRIGAAEHVLSLTVHHTVCDGQSLRLLLASLTEAYAARAAGLDPAWDPVDGPVAAPGTGTGTPGQRKRCPPAVLPTDRPRPRRADGYGSSLPIAVPSHLNARLRTHARQLRTTPFTLCCAAFALVLASWTGTRQFAFSIPIADPGGNRDQEVLGCFMRTVALHVEIPESRQVAKLVNAVRDAIEEAYDAPSVTRVEVAGRPPQVMLAYDEAHGRQFALAGTTVVPVPVESRVSKLDLTLYLDEAGDGYDCRIEYATALFDRSAMVRFGHDFVTALTGICAGELPALTAPPIDDPTARAAVAAAL